MYVKGIRFFVGGAITALCLMLLVACGALLDHRRGRTD